ncbi:thioredoxin domain-containing protein [Pediococcus acidilactici]|uniref:thioredoxin domain-containing protein n=1 Tax=Pediococcus acidilactici TaxID=1254 RepID=UPI00159C4278|nr:thioredoxin domain-containing protein [Pediococcus acidilactici]NVM33523.1 thioredoxin domain-containing protein [Pediococcus acidilactici]
MSQYTLESRQLNTVNYGLVNAAHDVTVILNLGCPDSRAWYLENEETLFAKVDTGKIRLHLKFWNKPLDNLINGGIANQYIDYQHPAKVRKLIYDIFTNQDQLNQLTEAQVAPYLRAIYSLTEQNNLATNLTAKEITAAGITGLPSIIVDDELKPEKSFELKTL